jgi:hypothetical protein
VALRRIERWYAEAAGVPEEGRCGSGTAIQRFGSSLNLNLHLHVIFLDGVYTRGADGRLSFRRVVPHTADVERLVVAIGEACEDWLSTRGFGPDEERNDDAGDDAQAVFQQASLFGPGGDRRARGEASAAVLQTGSRSRAAARSRCRLGAPGSRGTRCTPG